MSADELLALIGALFLCWHFWGRWVRDIMMIYDRRGSTAGSAALLAPLTAMLLLFMVLILFSSADVKNSALYLSFYIVLGLAWCGMMTRIFAYFGLDFRHDVAEQDNNAADIAVSGAVIGSMLCFAGGNIGNGPGWWVVIFCAVMATGGLMLLWLILDLLSGICEMITVERDVAAGIRFAGFMIGAGLVLGRSVAGDWVSLDVTWADFLRLAKPVLVGLIVAFGVDKFFKPSREVPHQDLLVAGLVPAMLYSGCALLYVMWLGAW